MSSSHTISDQGEGPSSPVSPQKPLQLPSRARTSPRFYNHAPTGAKWKSNRMQWSRPAPDSKAGDSLPDPALSTTAPKEREKSSKSLPKRREPTRRSVRIQEEQIEKEEWSRIEHADPENAAEEAGKQRPRKRRSENRIVKKRTARAYLDWLWRDAVWAKYPVQHGTFGKGLGPEGGDYIQHQKKLTLEAKRQAKEMGLPDLVYDDETDVEKERPQSLNEPNEIADVSISQAKPPVDLESETDEFESTELYQEWKTTCAVY